VHLAKTARTAAAAGVAIPHVFTTSHMTHAPIESWARAHAGDDFGRTVIVSPGRSIGLRLVPMTRDLYFAWQETAQQKLDEQKEKVRESLRQALIGWAKRAGEGGDYTDNLPTQCLHPVGHWFEVPNMLKNGVLRDLLRRQPSLTTLLVHNIDTLGVDIDPVMLGWHLRGGAAMSCEVIARRLEDRGGGLARIDGRLRLVEGLALPREEDEYRLTFYNSATNWVDIDRLLALFGLTRGDLEDDVRVAAAVRALAARLPTYVTLKEVKKRWGHGQEDVFPVAQFEKLWGDMTALADCRCAFAVVPRSRGQQLKDQAQLDGWARDGSAQGIEQLAGFSPTEASATSS
jgi:UTP--glucose-1-phosphate uridylyltransferase